MTKKPTKKERIDKFLNEIGYKEEEKEEKNGTVKLYNRHNFNIASLLPKGYGYNVQGNLHITDKYTEASNGHFLIRISTQDILREDLPTNNGLEPNSSKIDVLIDKDSAKKIQQNIPKNTRTFHHLNSTWIGKNTDNEKAEFIIIDITDWTPVIVRKQEGKFFNTDAIIDDLKKEKSIIELGFNAEYMKGLCEQIIKLKPKACAKGVKLSIYGKDKAIKMEAETNDTETGAEQKILILLMPMKI